MIDTGCIAQLKPPPPPFPSQGPVYTPTGAHRLGLKTSSRMVTTW